MSFLEYRPGLFSGANYSYFQGVYLYSKDSNTNFSIYITIYYYVFPIEKHEFFGVFVLFDWQFLKRGGQNNELPCGRCHQDVKMKPSLSRFHIGPPVPVHTHSLCLGISFDCGGEFGEVWGIYLPRVCGQNQ